VEPEAFALDLARRIRDRAAVLFGTPEARERTGTAHGGDPTYAIDAAAERVAEEAFGEIDDVAYFTEDEGLVVRGRPEAFFLVDPVDGTRPSAAGFETCGVTVAVAPYGDGVTLGDVTFGCMVELATGVTFEARRGGGAQSDGRKLAPSENRELARLFWAGGFRGQPAVPIAVVLGGLFDTPGSEGAFFDQGSAAYSLTRVGTGQLDAFVDPGPAMIDALPEVQEAFRRVGGGHVLNTSTYDAAAGYLLLWELGCPATDAVGGSLKDVPLIAPDGRATMVSTAAASTDELHAEVVDTVRAGIERLRRLLKAVGPEGLVGA
jgi:myo-inositol-1(or 4)-monophosphatase